MVEDGDEAVLRSGDPFGPGQRRIDACLAQPVGLVALGAVGGVEAFPDDLRIRRGYRAGADGAPGDLTGVIDIAAEAAAVEEKISTCPKGEHQAKSGQPSRDGSMPLGRGLGEVRRVVRVHFRGASGRA